MFNEEERRKELEDKVYDFNGWPDSAIQLAEELVSQEKSMIEQAKKEAVNEFVDRIEIHCSNGQRTKESIDKLLKEYNTKIF